MENPSLYQTDIRQETLFGASNLVVEAVAGSGKTTTLVWILKQLPRDKRVIFLAFNKSIAEELQSRLKEYPHIEVKTLHSLGFSLIRYCFKSIQLDNHKVESILSTYESNWDSQPDYTSRVKKLVDLYRVSMCTSIRELEILANKHEIELTNGECNYAKLVVEEMSKSTTTIDFTDMIYYAATKSEVRAKPYDLVFVDECQDMNLAQISLMMKLIKRQTGRFIAVGDRKQAIYGFAGSDSEAFEKLCKMPNTKILPLSINYRCPKIVGELVKRFVPQFQTRPDAPEGILDENASFKHVREGDFILCRATAPLVKLCLEYIKSKRKAYVKGKEIGENIMNMIKKFKVDDLDSMFGKFNYEKTKVFGKLKAKYPQLKDHDILDLTQYRLLQEKIDVIEAVCEEPEIINVNDLLVFMSQIFRDSSDGIALMTIHKSKGLETENIYVIERDLMPSRHAKQAWQLEQEENLEYVCYTRSKMKIGFITDFSYYEDRFNKNKKESEDDNQNDDL